MRKSIVEALVEQDGLDTDAACKIFDKEFWQLIILYLQEDYNRFYGEPLKQDRLLDTLTRIMGLKALVRLIRFSHQIASGHGKLYSLKLNSMLKPSSPYYSDFMPVYNTVTKSPDVYAKSDDKRDL